MSNGWTPERRARQAAMIQRWKPWQHSTGPTSDEGKAVVARNADQGGLRALLRSMAGELREQQTARRELAQRLVEPPLSEPDTEPPRDEKARGSSRKGGPRG